MPNREQKPVTVRVQTGNREALKNVQLYLFNSDGQLLETTSLANGEASLKSGAEDVDKGQVLVGPSLPEGYDQSRLNPLTIKKLGGYQPAIHLNRDSVVNIAGLPNLPTKIFDWCLITGNVTKVFNVDGQNKTLPVCDARVHICEVDRIWWWWWRIPPYIIADLGRKLKEVILNPQVIHPPIPDPDPDPLKGLSHVRLAEMDVRNVSPINKRAAAQMNQMQRMSQAKMLRSEHMQLTAGAQAEARTFASTASTTLPQHVQSGLLSSSASIVSDTIRNNIQLLHPYICLWPWFWPWFYFCDDIGTTYTDCNGRFNFEYLNITGDKDIYVWIEVNINGQWVTVYRPPLPCGTRWNYNCGSDINITVTDPRVMPCSCTQLHGELVWFRSIGEGATALHIEQNNGSTVSLQGTTIQNVGCTDIIDSKQISPFGDTLYFKLLFGDGLPTSGITHYRWRKTNIKDAALNDVLSPSTTVVEGLIQKTYFIITTDAQNHQHFETKAVTLGAEGTGQNIGYRIPHWDIYQDPGVPAADKLLTIQWTSPDFWSAIVDSKSLSDGLWRFDLELLQLDGAGNFNVVEVPKQVFQVSEVSDAGNSVDAPNAYLKLVLGNPAQARNLKVKVRIDNAFCNADIQDATITVNGTTEYSGACGFLHYTDVNQLTHISFIATHPRNFATFGFSVVKGNNTQPITPSVDQSGYVISSVGNYTLSGGIFGDDVPVSQLCGSCPQAAFAENLHVAALATNGTRRLYEYDKYDTNAFALSNT